VRDGFPEFFRTVGAQQNVRAPRRHDKQRGRFRRLRSAERPRHHGRRGRGRRGRGRNGRLPPPARAPLQRRQSPDHGRAGGQPAKRSEQHQHQHQQVKVRNLIFN